MTIETPPVAEILDRETTFAGHIKVQRFVVRLADGAEVVREVVSHGDAIAVLPYDAARKTALIVRLFRLPAFDRFGDSALVEACAGMVEEETTQETARREAMEEMGVRLSEMQFVGRVWSSPGVSAELVSLFLAPYSAADRVGPGGGAAGEHEGITVLEPRLADLAAEADAGRIVDLKLLALLQTLRVRSPALFA